MTTISRSDATEPAEPEPAEPAALYERDGKTFWRCLRCDGEHEALTPGQHVKVGNVLVGISCNGCAPVVCQEIRLLVPERSFHGNAV